MNTAQSQNPAGELYVHRIDELRAEIRRAMAAISGNCFQALEESLWRQEVLCTSLKHLFGSAQPHGEETCHSPGLQASLSALRQLNQSYAELLRQAQASNHLLLALGRSYNPSAHESAGMRCSFEV